MDKKKYYCASCLHVAKEKKLKIESAEITPETPLPVFCSKCGQEIVEAEDMMNTNNEVELVKSALINKNLEVVCFTAPSLRASLGEAFGLTADVQGKMVTALRMLGFDKVYDMNVAADFTTVEEAHEFKKRLDENKDLPMLTSCCPGWVSFVEKMYPEFKKHLSSSKSPQQMFGALINNIYTKSENKKSTDLFVVSIVPCMLKKLERIQEGINTAKGYDVDACLTTKELAGLIKEHKINFSKLKNSEFDEFFGEATGAGVIFGNTGGVMNAVLGSIDCENQNMQIQKLNTDLSSGVGGLRRGEIIIDNRPIKIAIVSGLNNAKTVLEELKTDLHKYDFVEVMSCVGGCVGGPGQIDISVGTDRIMAVSKRANVLLSAAKHKKIKRSIDNPALQHIYDQYLGGIGGKEAKRLLHRKFK